MKAIIAIIASALALAFVLPPDHKKVASNNGKFAFDIYAAIDKKDNVFLSPFSISAALAMTYAGADKLTRDQMQKVLHFDGSSYRFHQELSQLLSEIGDLNGKDLQISIANRLFADKDFKMLDSFVNINRDLYKAPVELVNYRKHAEEARLLINKWVEKQTQDKIKDLIPPKILDSLTRLVLVNAIYFYGDWQFQFDSTYTHDAPFYVEIGKEVKVKMMQQNLEAMYAENSSLQILRMPYKGNKIVMDIILPRKLDGLAELEKTLSFDSYEKLQAGLSTKKVQLMLPKFRVTTDFKLKDVLVSMGMEVPFTDRADFSKISTKTPVKIDEVIHKAFIDVSEKGTEAAAATAVIMKETDEAAEDDRAELFNANHPFFFLIRDLNSGSVLFMGRVQNPN